MRNQCVHQADILISNRHRQVLKMEHLINRHIQCPQALRSPKSQESKADGTRGAGVPARSHDRKCVTQTRKVIFEGLRSMRRREDIEQLNSSCLDWRGTRVILDVSTQSILIRLKTRQNARCWFLATEVPTPPSMPSTPIFSFPHIDQIFAIAMIPISSE